MSIWDDFEKAQKEASEEKRKNHARLHSGHEARMHILDDAIKGIKKYDDDDVRDEIEQQSKDASKRLDALLKDLKIE